MANFAQCLVAYFFSPIYTFIVPSSLVWPAYWLTIGLTCLMAWIDHWNSDHTAKNLRIMKASGISQLEIWGSAAATVLGFQLPGMYLLMNFFEDSYDGNNWTRPNLEEHLTMVNILTATAMVASTDLTFFYCHRWLHTTVPRTHLLHHSCVHSSLSTNMFFHPLDLAAEFTAPVLFLFAVCQLQPLGGSGAWMFSLCLAVTQAWYASGHDEWLGGHHATHHKSCATGYFIYKQYQYMDHEEEQVRHLIVDPEKRFRSSKIVT